MIETESNETVMNEEEGEDGETGSVYEYDDDVYASSEDEVIEPNIPTPAQDNDGPDREVTKTQRYLCAGVILPYFDLLEAWEDGEHPIPGPHYVDASTSRPKKVMERRERVDGTWRLKNTMCKRCFRMDKAHEKELNAFHTSGLSETAYFNLQEGKRKAKALRKEKNEAAAKRVRTALEQGPTLMTPKATPKEKIVETPVKFRHPTAVPAMTPTASSSSSVAHTSPIVDLTLTDHLTTSPTYKSTTLATLLAGVASANNKGSVSTATQTAPSPSTAPPVTVDLTPTTTNAGTQTTVSEMTNVATPPVSTVITAATDITHATPAATGITTAPAIAAASATPPGTAPAAAPTPADATAATPATVTSTATPARTAETITATLAAWLQQVRAHLKVADLKDLCRVNKLMVSGSKNALLDRLLKCKYHGSPGACPLCRQCKMQCEYLNEDLLSLPVLLRCKHMRGAGLYCSYVAQILHRSYFLQAKRDPKVHALPLVDTEDGVLERYGISAGSVLA